MSYQPAKKINVVLWIVTFHLTLHDNDEFVERSLHINMQCAYLMVPFGGLKPDEQFITQLCHTNSKLVYAFNCLNYLTYLLSQLHRTNFLASFLQKDNLKFYEIFFCRYRTWQRIKKGRTETNFHVTKLLFNRIKSTYIKRNVYRILKEV